MLKKNVTYEMSEKDFDSTLTAISLVRKYFDADGAESSDLLEDALDTLEWIFKID
jgi:hypothetical protein